MRLPGYPRVFLTGGISALCLGKGWLSGWGVLVLPCLKSRTRVPAGKEPGFDQACKDQACNSSTRDGLCNSSPSPYCGSFSQLTIPKLGNQIIQAQFMELGGCRNTAG